MSAPAFYLRMHKYRAKKQEKLYTKKVQSKYNIESIFLRSENVFRRMKCRKVSAEMQKRIVLPLDKAKEQPL